MKTISHEELLDKYIGEKETNERMEFENELQLDVLSFKLKELRKQKQLSQTELGKLIGKDKSQISKIEKGTQNLTIQTILQIMKALNTKFKFRFEIEEETVEFGGNPPVF
jgi:DNA-binding XRE family transcriptional regulator